VNIFLPKYVTSIASSGVGYSPAFAFLASSDFSSLVKLLILAESLEFSL
jgi:hypothetical protein